MTGLYARLLPVLPALFWLALCFAFVMAILPDPPRVVPIADDKLQHMFAFAVLAGLAGLAWPRLRLRWIALGLAAFGALIEVAQMTPGLNRTADVMDLAADVVAIFATLVAIKVARVALGARRTG